MKKTLSILVIFTIMLSVFFCIPVYAATPSLLNRHVAQVTSGSIAINAVAYQGYPYSFGTSLIGGYGQDTYVYLTIYNSSITKNYRVGNCTFTLNYSSTPIFLQQEVITSDLICTGATATGTWNVLASEQFTDGNTIIVPSRSTLCLLFCVTTRAEFNTSSQTVTGSSLSSIDLNNSVSVSEYNGNKINEPVDLSSIESDIESIISIAENIEYSGTSYTFTSDNSNTNINTWQHDYNGNNYGNLKVVRLIGRPYLLSVDVNNNATTDTSSVNGTVRYPFLIKILNYYNTKVSTYYELDLTGLFPSPPITTAVNITSFYSQQFSTIFVASEVTNNVTKLIHSHPDGNKSYYNAGYYNTYITGYYDVPVNVTPQLSGVTYREDYSQVRPYNGSFYYPSDEYTILRDLYMVMNSSNSSSVSSDSDTLSSQSNQIHSQEESYYAQNSQAIEATGLSNYQFDNNSVSGIQGVRGDFIAVWNALSGWNSIYIFSLTLGLALTILRHSPSAISSAINRRKFKSNGRKTP